MNAGIMHRSCAVPLGFLVVSVLIPSSASANPVSIDPTSLIAFGVVAFWAFVIEAGIVALLVAFRGLAPLRVFMAYFLTNIAVFLFLFLPLLGRKWPVLPLEILIVLVDSLCIKVLASLETFQGDQYRGVSWLRSTAIAGIANTASWFVGYVASHKPWVSA
jgi:hypothetical protein